MSQGFKYRSSACICTVPVTPELEARAPTGRKAQKNTNAEDEQDGAGVQRFQLPELGMEREGSSKEEQEEAPGARQRGFDTAQQEKPD